MNSSYTRLIIEKLKLVFNINNNELNYKNKFHTIVAIMLSSRTTDVQVKLVMNKFMELAKDPYDVLKLDINDCKRILKHIGFYNIKSRNLIKLAECLKDVELSESNLDFEFLTKLPGIGRKSANLILSTLFNKPLIAVDTHVARVSKRIGWTKHDIPIKIENDLENCIPITYRSRINILLVSHGRRFCKPYKPLCSDCPIATYCDYFN